MTYIHVEHPGQTASLAEDLAEAERIALDCEAAGFHRYSDRLCLVQLTVATRTYVVDPLGLDPADLLRPALEDPSVEIVMHGADFDLRLLRRDLDIGVRGLFDTQIAAALLGEPSVGLAALLESRLGITLSKKYQRADWANRPLSREMLEYGADDTRHIIALADLLIADLGAAGRVAWVGEECRLLERIAATPTDEEPEDPVTRVKGARSLSAREVTALREALEWRDRLARKKDRAPFRVVGDQPLVEVVVRRLRNPEELREIKGFPRALARSHGGHLVRRLERVDALEESDLRPYPPPQHRGPGRPPPEVEALVDRLKAARNRRAGELGLDRGTLLSNAVLLEVAQQEPTSPAALAAVDGIRSWQAEAVGPDLLAAVRRPS